MSMKTNFQWHQGADQASLAEHLAGEITVIIAQSIRQRGVAVVALSGGSTPKLLFQALANSDIDWSKVVITLVDERWVDESDDLSNGAFLKRYLLNHISSDVRFAPLYFPAETVGESCDQVLQNYCQVTDSSIDALHHFDIVILGMGNDGHTASFFPDADNIAHLVSDESTEHLLTCSSPSTQVERITWSLPMLLNSQFLALHITGQKKQTVFQQASLVGKATELPIRSVIFQQKNLLNVYHAD